MMQRVVAAMVVLAAVGASEMWSGRVVPTGRMWRLNYTIDTTTAKFHATLICKSKGWIGMGLSYNIGSGPVKTDVMVAFAINGTKSIHDQFSLNHTQPILDVQLGGKEDLTLVNMGSNADSLWVTYSRNLDTNDGDRDIVIQNKDVYVSGDCGNDTPIVRTGPNGTTISYEMHPVAQSGIVRVNFFNATATRPPSRRSRNRVGGTNSPQGSSDSSSSSSSGGTTGGTSSSGGSSSSSSKSSASSSIMTLTLLSAPMTLLILTWLMML